MPSIEKRQKEICGICNHEKIPIMLLVGTGKKKMVKQCKCGLIGRTGRKINIE